MFLELTGFPLILVAIIAFIVILGLIICLHELGHFYVARKSGILCHEFSIGMGPAIYKKPKGETTFCLRAIPIGGYVSMAGEQPTDEYTKIGTTVGLNLEDDIVKEIILDDSLECQVRGEITDRDLDGKDGKDLYITLSDDLGEAHYYQVKEDATYIFEKGEKLQMAPWNRVFDSKPIWKRFLTLVAGPVMNFILAFIIYLIVAFASGVPNYDSNTIGSVTSGYPADVAGIVAGDQITAVDGNSVSSWVDFSNKMKESFTDYSVTVDVTVLHDGVEKTYTLPIKVAINSLGISNMGIDERQYDNSIVGLRIGSVGNASSGSLPFKAYSILSKVRIKNEKETLEYDLTDDSWPLVLELFDKQDNCTVQFEYYSLKDSSKETWEYEKTKLDKCSEITPWNNEVLENQAASKIVHYIGVAAGTHFSFFGCIGSACSSFWSDFTLVFRTLKLLIAPSSSRQVGINDLSSVVGIFDLIKQYVGAGFLALLSLTAMLSVNIGIMNLLPIPALDGGRILFLAVEAITKKKPSKKVENIITLVFMGLLLLLFVYVTFNDILRLIR